ncbi:MAG: hypothetical protein GY814_13350 [Gammaproteobacteria bacterium]|nr:hypothetical protein [Gammaproteobacteria bacterium]
MKWLFLLLLIINLGILGWGYQHEQMRQNVHIVAGSDVGDMRLLNEPRQVSESEAQVPMSELEPEIAAQETDSDIEAAVVTTTAESSEKAEMTTEIAAETESAPQQQKKNQTKTEAETEGLASTEQVVDMVIDTEEQTVSLDSGTEKPVEPQTGNGPVVDIEMDPKEQTTTDDTETEEPVQERSVAGGSQIQVKPEITSMCGSIGPLKYRKKAKEIVQELIRSKLKAKLERSVEKKEIGFWVVIPPLTDGSRAQAKINELARAGLKDIWHFRGGGLKNAISLGMFSKKKNAENYSREVLKKGFKTKIQPKYLNKTSYTVKFSIEKPKIVTRLMWRMVERKYSKHEFHEQSCEPIATR